MSVAIAPGRRRRPLVITGFVASVLVQLVMIAIGVWAVILTEDDESVTDLLALWCVIGTLYEVDVLIVLGRLATRPVEAEPGPQLQPVRRRRWSLVSRPPLASSGWTVVAACPRPRSPDAGRDRAAA